MGSSGGGSSRTALAHPRLAANITQGRYVRTTPTPDSGSGIYVLCKDPNQAGVNGTGRLWALGAGSGMIGYTDDDGATFTPVIAVPNGGVAGMSACQIEITSGVAGGDFMFVLTNSATANQGQLWRSAAPGANPALVFTCIQGNDSTVNLVNGPGGAASHTADGSNYRNQSFAIQPDGSHAYLVNYAAGVPNATPTARTDGIMAAGSDILALPTSNGFYGSQHGMAITVSGAGAGGATLNATIMRIFGSGKVQLDQVAQTSVSGATVTFPADSVALDIHQGPNIRVCANPCAASAASVLWTVGKAWSMARHAHAVKVIGGVPWVNLGDFPYPNDGYGVPPLTHVGMWAATDATGATWNQKMVPSAYAPYDGINFFPVTVGGQPLIVMESDSKAAVGPVVLPTQSNAAGIIAPFTGLGVQAPVVATMRCLTVLSNGNLMWYGTGEGGGVGPVDGIFLSASPYDSPILLEQLAAGAAGTLYNAIQSNGYVWMGKLRITPEKFVGDA